jgi:hypothetical protein
MSRFVKCWQVDGEVHMQGLASHLSLWRTMQALLLGLVGTPVLLPLVG